MASAWSDFCGQMLSIGTSSRALQSSEIDALEGQGCTAEAWEDIVVADDFSPRGYRNVALSGSCFLSSLTKPCFDGERSWSSVVKDVELHDVKLAASVHISRTARIEKTVLGSGVIVFNCGRLLGSARSSWPIEIEVGNEMGGRSLWLSPEMTCAEAEEQVFKSDESESFRQKAARDVASLQGGDSWLGASSQLMDTPLAREICLGPKSKVTGAQGLDAVIAIGDEDQPVTVGAGSQLERVILQWGAVVDGAAQVRDALVGDGTHVGLGAMVEQSFLAHSNGIGKGEVTACLLGPFVAMHHQSLAIGLIWPEGRGNIAYGANVGSNHTGKLPDQEAFPGEGCFLGLGCSIKFPAHFRKAPYTLISTGVTTQPMRLELPFSLILPPSPQSPEHLRHINQLQPAWVLGENLYALVRNELKFAKRFKSKREVFLASWLRPDTVKLMLEASERLSKTFDLDWVTEKVCEGLGSNVISPKWRARAIEEYERFSLFFALESTLLGEASSLSDSILQKRGFERNERVPMLESYLSALDEQLLSIESSKRKDIERGHQITDDYDKVHPSLEEDAVICAWRQKRDWASENLKK